MTFDELESGLSQLMSLPLMGKLTISIQESTKNFSLSIPIFLSGKKAVPLAVQKYVSSLQGKTFKPQKTSYHFIENLNQIHLVQELAFETSGQQSLRSQLREFWELSKKCHQLLCELAAEEKLELFEQA